MNDGEKLRKIRIRKELTQYYIASKLGKSQKAISDLEHLETIEEQKIIKLCEVLEITKADFDNYVDEMIFESTMNESDKLVIRYLLKIIEEQIERKLKLRNLFPVDFV